MTYIAVPVQAPPGAAGGCPCSGSGSGSKTGIIIGEGGVSAPPSASSSAPGAAAPAPSFWRVAFYVLGGLLTIRGLTR